MNTYERKLAVKRVNADARNALHKWYKLHTVGIDDILFGMGYTGSRCGYKFTKRYYPGMESFTLVIDTYDLIIKHDGKLNVEVQ